MKNQNLTHTKNRKPTKQNFLRTTQPHLASDIPVAISQPRQKWKLDGLGYAQNETCLDNKFNHHL